MDLRSLKFQLALHAIALVAGLLAWLVGDLPLWLALALAELGVVILPGLLVLAVLAVLTVLRGPE